MKNKILISNKIYPYYYGLSLDLMFWAAISTIFLTIVKKFSVSQINSLTSISIVTCVIGYPLVLKIIKKIGNINSIKFGNVSLLLASILITFFKNYHGVLIGFIFYQYAFLFKSIDNVILRNNLKYLGKEELFFKYQTKGTLIYSILTLIISLLSGMIFNINNYLPMYISILICVLNCILMNFIKEAPIDNNNKLGEKENKFKAITKSLLLILLFSLIVYSLIDCGQMNSKLFLQDNMSKFINEKKVVLYLSFIIFVSRIFRVLFNIIFNKIYEYIKRKLSLIINLCLILSFSLILFGNLFQKNITGIITMSIGFIIYLSIRDLVDNYFRTILLDNCDPKTHDDVAVYYYLARKIGDFILSGIISIITFKLPLKYAFIFLLILSVLAIPFALKVNNIANKGSEN